MGVVGEGTRKIEKSENGERYVADHEFEVEVAQIHGLQIRSDIVWIKVCEFEVLGDREVGYERRILEDSCNASLERCGGCGQVNGLAVDGDGACVT